MNATRMQELIDGAEMTMEDARFFCSMGADQHVVIQAHLTYAPWQYADLTAKAARMTASGKSAAQLIDERAWQQDERMWEASKQRQWKESADEMRRMSS